MSKTLEFKFERVIPVDPREAFDAWLNPELPCCPWNENDKIIVDAQVDGLWYWHARGKPHCGRFTEVERGSHVKYTWMSPHTLGLESTVSVTFKKQGDSTLMTLTHANLPDHELAAGHKNGWATLIEKFAKELSN